MIHLGSRELLASIDLRRWSG